MTSGFVGAGIKALGFKYSFGGTEQEISLNISYDSESYVLSGGGALITRKKGEGELTMGGVFGGGKTTEKETGTERSIGVNLETGKIVSKKTEIADTDFKEVEEGTISVMTGTEKEGEETKLSFGLNPEVNLGIVGTGVGINLSIQENNRDSDPSKGGFY